MAVLQCRSVCFDAFVLVNEPRQSCTINVRLVSSLGVPVRGGTKPTLVAIFGLSLGGQLTRIQLPRRLGGAPADHYGEFVIAKREHSALYSL
jgi:hypothetical protein